MEAIGFLRNVKVCVVWSRKGLVKENRTMVLVT
jgi:hypothetical protein